jgi:hypothetical protein
MCLETIPGILIRTTILTLRMLRLGANDESGGGGETRTLIGKREPTVALLG